MVFSDWELPEDDNQDLPALAGSSFDISLDGSFIVQLYTANGEPPDLSKVDIGKLYEAFRVPRRAFKSRIDDYIWENIQELDDGEQPPFGPDLRGPYYGIDQLREKLGGMSGAMTYGIDIYHRTTEDGIDVFYADLSNAANARRATKGK